jgi:hypothetical protein
MIHFGSSFKMMMRTILFLGLILELIGLSAAMTVNKDQVEQSSDLRFASSMQIDEVLKHLNELQNIATASNGNRAARTIGFNRTLDYITDYLTSNTDLKVTRSFFNMRNFQLLRNPTLISTINGVSRTYTYSTQSDFYHVQFSTSANINTNVLLTAIPNLGCSDADWLAARIPPAGMVALVKRGDCTFEDKARLATKYKVAALLLLNDGRAGDGTRPIYINLGQNNLLPALFLSYSLGQTLTAAANDPSRLATVRLTISTDTALNPVGNICADTKTGDPTQTILVGSHSDSVTAGSGINDNGTINK